jgi:hypothetical protein
VSVRELNREKGRWKRVEAANLTWWALEKEKKILSAPAFSLYIIDIIDYRL